MNIVENFRLVAAPFQTQNLEITPSYTHNIVGFFLQHKNNMFAGSFYISLITANSETIINSVPDNILQYKFPVEWEKSFIPTDIPSQRLFLRVENTTPQPLHFDFVLIYDKENPTD